MTLRRILICGDRNWSDQDAMDKVFDTLDPQRDFIIHGGAKGADNMAGDTAMRHFIGYTVYPAEWNKYGKAAGHIRNQLMIDDGKPDIVIYFHDNLHKSKGTKDMVNRARRHGIGVYSWLDWLITKETTK